MRQDTMEENIIKQKRMQKKQFSMDFDEKIEALKAECKNNTANQIAAGILENKKIRPGVNQDVVKAIKELQDLKEDSHLIMTHGPKDRLVFSKR